MFVVHSSCGCCLKDHVYDVEDDLDLISPRMRMQKHEA